MKPGTKDRISRKPVPKESFQAAPVSPPAGQKPGAQKEGLPGQQAVGSAPQKSTKH